MFKCCKYTAVKYFDIISVYF